MRMLEYRTMRMIEAIYVGAGDPRLRARIHKGLIARERCSLRFWITDHSIHKQYLCIQMVSTQRHRKHMKSMKSISTMSNYVLDVDKQSAT